jgi:hypothetical protein
MYHAHDTEVVAATVTQGVANEEPVLVKRIDINKAHNLLGHGNESVVRKAALALGWEIKRGALRVCEPVVWKHLKFSDFFDTKNGMVEQTCEQLRKMEGKWS